MTGRRCSAPPARPRDELSVTKVTFFFTNSHSASAAGDALRTAGRACPDPLTPAGRALPVLSNTRQQCCCKNHATSKPTASAPVAQPARTVLSVGSGARRKAVRHVYHKRRHRRPDEHRGTARGCANDGTTQIATSAADTALPVLEDCQTSCRNVRKSLAGGCLSKNQGSGPCGSRLSALAAKGNPLATAPCGLRRAPGATPRLALTFGRVRPCRVCLEPASSRPSDAGKRIWGEQESRKTSCQTARLSSASGEQSGAL